MNSTSTEAKGPTDVLPLREPGVGGGLFYVARWRFLLMLLVRKELRVRYRGSVLGIMWSYVKPLVQFLVYYVALGVFLGLNKTAAYSIYLFSGIVAINFFNEIFGNATRSVVLNADLVKKIYLPRELFPVSMIWVALVHLVPQLIILMGGALLLFDWRPGPLNLLAGVVALIIVAVLALGLGLLFSAVNVLYRDAENIVDLFLMVGTWASPVLYTWDKVYAKVPQWLWVIYQANPLTPAVELMHYCFWLPATHPRAPAPVPPHLALWSLLSIALCVVALAVGQFVFARLQGRFAQEL